MSWACKYLATVGGSGNAIGVTLDFAERRDFRFERRACCDALLFIERNRGAHRGNAFGFAGANLFALGATRLRTGANKEGQNKNATGNPGRSRH